MIPCSINIFTLLLNDHKPAVIVNMTEYVLSGRDPYASHTISVSSYLNLAGMVRVLTKLPLSVVEPIV